MKTQEKTVWLGHYFSSEMQSRLRVDAIADQSVCALHYSDARLPDSIVGATPYRSAESLGHLTAPPYPTHRTPFPGFVIHEYDMHYSEAPLDGLVQVHVCSDAGYCLGILLDYGNYSTTVGQYRYDKEISDAYEPHCIELLPEPHVSNPRVRIRTRREETIWGETKHPILRLTHGVIVWWFGKDVSVVNIRPLD